jgi:hypothetical protein
MNVTFSFYAITLVQDASQTKSILGLKGPRERLQRRPLAAGDVQDLVPQLAVRDRCAFRAAPDRC